MTSDLGVLAQLAYQAGITPLDFAEEQVALLFFIHAAYADEVGPDVAARRVLGALLDAGWSPPVLTPEPGVCT